MLVYNSRGNGESYGKYVTVNHDDRVEDLTNTVTVWPDTGSFTLMNKGNELAFVELVLTINELKNLDEEEEEEGG